MCISQCTHISYMIMHNDDTPSRYNHMCLVHTHHQSRMHLVCYNVYDLVLGTHTYPQDHMYITRCCSRMKTRSRCSTCESRGGDLLCYYTDISHVCQGDISW